MIVQLKIKNFKHIVDVDLEFDNINLISGEPGQGKTAIIEAINLHYTNKLDDRIIEYVRWGQKKFEIEITEFCQGQKIWHKIEGTTGLKHQLILNDNSENAYYDSNAVKKLAEFYDTDIIENSNISMQHQSTRIIEQRRTPRLRTMKKIFKIDKIDKVVEIMKEEKTNLESEKRILHDKIQVLEGQKFNFEEEPILPDIDIIFYREQHEKFLKDKELWQEQKSKYEIYKRTLFNWEEAQEQIKKYKQEIKEWQQECEELQEKIVDEGKYNEENYLSTKENLNKKEKEYILLKNDLAEYEKAKKDFDDVIIKIKRYEDEKQKLNKILNSYNSKKEEEKLDKFKNDLNVIDKEILNVNNEIDLYEKGKCPITKKECKVAKEINYELVKKKQQDLYQERSNLQNSINIINNAKKDYVKYLNDIRFIEEKIKIIQDSIKKSKEIVVNYNNYRNYNEDITVLTNLEGKIDELEKHIEKFEKEKLQYNRAKRNNEKINNLIQEHKEKIKNYFTRIELREEVKKPREFRFTVEFNEKELSDVLEVVKEYETVDREVSFVRKANKKIQEQKINNERKISDLEENYYKHEKNIKILYESYNLLDKNFCSYLIDIGTKRVKENMNNFFGKSYGKYSVEFKQDSNGVDFFYSQNDKDLHSVSTLSGFEKQVFAVAWRIALIPEHYLPVMVFDEIDSDGPSKSSIALYNTILNSDVGQVIAITHNTDTKDFLLNKGANFIEINKGIQL
jgi:DNA repair exonuclease SbcCD ATPase subunit